MNGSILFVFQRAYINKVTEKEYCLDGSTNHREN